MAQYHKNIKYHKDETPKHKMTDDERMFLLQLQNELNTQDTLSQADPRYWVIAGREKMYHIEASEANGYELYDSECCETVADTLEECKKYIEETLLDEINDSDGLHRSLTIKTDPVYGKYILVVWVENDETHRKSLYDSDDVAEWLDEMGYAEYKVIPYKYIPKIYSDTMFLTEKDAREHLKSNEYHYDETAHTYAMTAWRSPRMDKLLQILRQVEF